MCKELQESVRTMFYQIENNNKEKIYKNVEILKLKNVLIKMEKFTRWAQ
jgi:hypothetical protein